MLGSVGVLEGHEHTLVEKLLINGDTILLGHQHLGELWKKMMPINLTGAKFQVVRMPSLKTRTWLF